MDHIIPKAATNLVISSPSMAMDQSSPKPTDLLQQEAGAVAVNNNSDAAAKVTANSSSSSNDDEKSRHDVVVISSTNNGSTNQQHENCDQQTPARRRDYACRFCDKKFYTKQALGGHQNAHKAERANQYSAASQQQHVVGSMMSSLLFHAPLVTGYYPPRHHPYSLHDFAAAVNRPRLAFNNNAAAVNNHHRPVLGFAGNVPARFVAAGSNVYGGGFALAPPPARVPSLMAARVPSNYVRFPNMNPFPAAAAGYNVNLAGHAVEEEADETGLDLSLKLGYTNRG